MSLELLLIGSGLIALAFLTHAAMDLIALFIRQRSE